MSQASLQALYPFLHGKSQDAIKLDEALAHSVSVKAAESRAANEAFFVANAEALVGAARTLARMWQASGRLLAMGNGGSSCDAAHVTVEFLHPITAGRPALPTVNLGADLAMLSAVGNDVGFDQVFARQIEAHGRDGDAVIGFSTSGNSANLLEGFATARKKCLITLGFAGGDGGKMKTSGLVDHLLVAETQSVHRVQECHVAGYHILWDLVHTLLADTRGAMP
jgi:D-sedoheptulose 7-phosphate isomerase